MLFPCRVPEAGVVEGVQVGRVGPADVAAFTAQLHVPPRSLGRALPQAQETSLIQDLCKQGLASPPSILLLQFGVTHLHPFAPGPDAVLSNIFPAFDLLAGTYRQGEAWREKYR